MDNPVFWNDPTGLYEDFGELFREVWDKSKENDDDITSFVMRDGKLVQDSNLTSYWETVLQLTNLLFGDNAAFGLEGGGAEGALKGLKQRLEKNEKIDINKELGLIGVTISEAGRHQWIGLTSKGKLRRYNRKAFRGNQYTTDLKLFKRAGRLGLFVQIGADGLNLIDNPEYQERFLKNTGLTITSFIIPEVGVGLLMYDAAVITRDIWNAAWEHPKTQDFFRRLLRDFNRWVFEESQGTIYRK